ncbi:hypothetical protein ACFLR8_03725, partial [Bacteroidota bacterium]
AGLPSLVFAYRYLSIWNPPDYSTRLPLNELLKWIFDVRSLIIHNYVAEAKFSRIIFIVAVGLFLFSIIKFSLCKARDKLHIKLNSPQFFFGILSMIFLILYFIFPNNSSGGGYISVRLNILFYLVFFTWLSTLKYPSYLIKIGFVVVLISTIGLLFRNHVGLRGYKNLVENFTEAEEHVTENSVILPIRNSGRMLDGHFPHYLGWNKPVIILENFEATTRYYPLEWNREELPCVMLGDSILMDVCLYNRFPSTSINQVNIDYVVVWGTDDMNDCKKDLLTIVNRDYNMIYTSESPKVSLYKLNSQNNY